MKIPRLRGSKNFIMEVTKAYSILVYLASVET